MRKVINPYTRALSLVWHRLRWDIRPESWRSRAKIKEWKDKFSGEKAVILCNGPSLLKSDFSLLDEVFTFGLNKINLLFDKVDFRPSCVVSVNRFVLEQNAGFFNETNVPLFLDRSGLRHVRPRENITFLHTTNVREFAGDCTLSLDAGYTVTYVALQLAFHMGFEEVALIGCDHDFATKGPANETVEAGESDPNHFDSNYFADGDKWQLPDLTQSEVSYQLARQAYEADGRRVCNATVGGELDIFPRKSLHDFVSNAVRYD